MNETERTVLHDQTVDRLYHAINAICVEGSEFKVLRNVRWMSDKSFPNCVELYDIVIVDEEPAFQLDNLGAYLGETNAIVTLLDVICSDCESEFYDKPISLLTSCAYEYVVYDPSSELMRPNLLAYRKGDLGFENLRPAIEGTFFSTVGFRLDTKGDEISVRPCGSPLIEEELWECRRDYRKRPSSELAEEIRELEERLARPRRRRGE